MKNNVAVENPRNDQRRERLLTIALTAWDLERLRADDRETRTRLMVFKTHERLGSLAEAERGVEKHKRSFLKVGEPGKLGVLLVHGADQSPANLVPLARTLNEAGLTVHGMLLVDYGHGVTDDPEARWRASLQQIRQGYTLLERSCPGVAVVGVGFGAALALHLAKREKVSSLVLVAPELVARVGFWVRLVQRLKLLRVPFVRRRLVHVVDALECMSQAEDLAGQLDVPILGVHCDDDPVVSPASLRSLQKKARHRQSRFQAFPEGGHDVLAAHGGKGLERDIARFITQETRV